MRHRAAFAFRHSLQIAHDKPCTKQPTNDMHSTPTLGPALPACQQTKDFWHDKRRCYLRFSLIKPKALKLFYTVAAAQECKSLGRWAAFAAFGLSFLTLVVFRGKSISRLRDVWQLAFRAVFTLRWSFASVPCAKPECNRLLMPPFQTH